MRQWQPGDRVRAYAGLRYNEGTVENTNGSTPRIDVVQVRWDIGVTIWTPVDMLEEVKEE